jgi:hypothetical protein
MVNFYLFFKFFKKQFLVRGRGRPVHAGRVSPRSPTTPTTGNAKNMNGALPGQPLFRPNQPYRRQRGQRQNDIYTNMMMLANKSMTGLQSPNFNFYLPGLNGNNGGGNGAFGSITSMLPPGQNMKMEEPTMNGITPTKTNDVKSMEQLFKDFGKTGSSDSLCKLL